MRLERKFIVGGAIGLVLVLVAVGYTVMAAGRQSSPAGREDVGLAAGRLYFRDTQTGRVAYVPLSKPTEPRTISGRACSRFSATRTEAVCLTAFDVIVLDRRLRERTRTKSSGAPSRARISGSGDLAAWTAFTTGDSYVGSSGFSTRTGIMRTSGGWKRSTLETLRLTVDGKRYRSVDVNYWGVTFADDDNTFYATVSTKGRTYLVKGDLRSWSATALRQNAECPSLSPDGTRLVFKKRVSSKGDAPWRLHVLDLRTMRETPLAEHTGVDDQAVWLDRDTIAYGRSPDIYRVPADGTGRPELLVEAADSPAPVR